MQQYSDSFLRAMQSGNAPVVLAFLTTVRGVRVYGKMTPSDAEVGLVSEAFLADGTVKADGTATAGAGVPVIERSARVISFSPLRNTLTAQSGQLLLSLTSNETRDFQIALNNADRYFSRILANESFLSGTLEVRLGFCGLDYNDFLSVFTGEIQKETVKDTTLQLDAIAN